MSGTIKEAHLSLADKALRYFCWGVVHTVQRPKVCGGKPAHDGPTIYACRHVGLMDPVILMVEYFRWMIRPLVAKDYYDKSREYFELSADDLGLQIIAGKIRIKSVKPAPEDLFDF